MKKNNLYYSLFFAFLLLSCSDDDTVATKGIPIINPQIIEVSEDITDSEVIGNVIAEDPNGDVLDFRIAVDNSKLFKLTSSGELSLRRDKQLDFETATEHRFTVRVTDGKGEFFNDVTIMVLDAPEPPVVQNHTFEVREDITDADIIGTVQAQGFEGNLTFAMGTNDNGLFNITESGELSLNSGESLDYETATEHDIRIVVSDGINEPAESLVTIIVTDVAEAEPSDAAAFVTTWSTTIGNESIEMGVSPGLKYNYTINWGDGTVEDIIGDTNPTHNYATAGTYTVTIVGDFPALRMESVVPSQRDKLMSLEKWGNNPWETMEAAFYDCENMEYNATDTPDLSLVTNMASMFENARSFNGAIGDWDVSNVKNMSRMFLTCLAFNQYIGDWNVSKVTNMFLMFGSALVFNQDLSGWNVGLVEDMELMFKGTDAFNQPIGDWNVERVTNMSGMFDDAVSFNQDLSNWDVSSVTEMETMFLNAAAFDQSLGAWEIHSISSMIGMFANSGLSAQNYSDTLTGWASDPNTPGNIPLNANGINYCASIAETYDFLTTPVNQNGKGWSILDDGPVNCNL